jgi:hypothetical protein
MSGFNSVQSFVESCKSVQFDERLRDARKASIRDCEAVECARVAQRRYALQAARVIRQIRALNLSQWDCERFNVSGPGRSGSGAGLVTARRLMDKRAEYVSMARHYKAVADKAARVNLAQFESLLDGLYSDKFADLRRVFGMVDKLGRNRGAAKLNAGFIKVAAGKVAKGAKVATVSLPVGKFGVARPCAPVAPVDGKLYHGTLYHDDGTSVAVTTVATRLPCFMLPDAR